jgi:hypothetical protein
MPALLKRAETRLEKLDASLRALNPSAVLDRGYAVVKVGDRIVARAAETNIGENVRILLSDGELGARIEEIRTKLRHGCTEIDAIGTYTGTKKSVLICVINKHQLYEFQKILAQHKDTFSYFEVVNETYGNFKQIK